MNKELAFGTMKPNKFIVIGDLCMDVFMQIEQYPPEGGDGSVRQFHQHAGGSASNTAIVLARLGNDPALLTHCGKDIWAQQLLPILDGCGVSTDLITQEDQHSTGLTFLVVSELAERTMFTYRGANLLLHPDQITEKVFGGVNGLHISAYACLVPPQSEAVMKAVQLASTRKLFISLDVGVEPASKARDQILTMFPFLSVVILSESEATTLTQTQTLEKAISTILAKGVGLIALKLGEKGCRLISRDNDVNLPGFPVEPIDSTGAGDSFCAGLIHGVNQGWDLTLSGTLANAFGALATTRWGAGEKLPTLDEICEYLQLQNTNNHNPTLNQLFEKLGRINR